MWTGEGTIFIKIQEPPTPAALTSLVSLFSILIWKQEYKFECTLICWIFKFEYIFIAFNKEIFSSRKYVSFSLICWRNYPQTHVLLTVVSTGQKNWLLFVTACGAAVFPHQSHALAANSWGLTKNNNKLLTTLRIMKSMSNSKSMPCLWSQHQ